MSESISMQIQAGNFWGKDGAIANTRKLALIALNQPGSNLIDAISLMTSVHAKAAEYAGGMSKKVSLSYRIHLWKKRQKISERALWCYNMLWRIVTFWNYV